MSVLVLELKLPSVLNTTVPAPNSRRSVEFGAVASSSLRAPTTR